MKIYNVLSVFCTDKGYKCVDNVIHKNKEVDRAKHFPVYPDASKWSTELNVEIKMVDPNATPYTTTSVRPNIKVLTNKIHIFEENLQKQRLSEYNLKSKIKQQEWDKYIADKNAVMTLVCG